MVKETKNTVIMVDKKLRDEIRSLADNDNSTMVGYLRELVHTHPDMSAIHSELKAIKRIFKSIENHLNDTFGDIEHLQDAVTLTQACQTFSWILLNPDLPMELRNKIYAQMGAFVQSTEGNKMLLEAQEKMSKRPAGGE